MDCRGALPLLFLAASALVACSEDGVGAGPDASRSDARHDARTDSPERDTAPADVGVDAALEGGGPDSSFPGDAGSPSDGSGLDALPSDSSWFVDSSLEASPLEAGTYGDAQPDVYPAPHPPMPTVVNSGGSVLTTPIFVPVLYASDPIQGEVASFFAALAASSAWGAAASEYGAAGATSSAPLLIPTPPPATLGQVDLDDLLENNLAGPASPWGAPSPNAVYVVFIPPGTTNGTSFFPGHHAATANASGQLIVYAVVDESPLGVVGDGGVNLDAVTALTMHELVEAVTDPQFTTYAEVDTEDAAWALSLFGGVCPGCSELGDMCELYPSSDYTPPDLGYRIQRTWSNSSAGAGHDPCVPIPTGEVYFNSAVVPTDNIVLPTAFGAILTHGIQIAAGGSRTIDLALYSDGPTEGPWSVSAYNCGTFSGGLNFTFDNTSGTNGDVLHLTLDVPASASKAESFCVSSTLGALTNVWYGVVGN